MKNLNEEMLEKLDNLLSKPTLDSYNQKDIKKVKSNDRGLIERANSSKIILTEDNKQLLSD